MVRTRSFFPSLWITLFTKSLLISSLKDRVELFCAIFRQHKCRDNILLASEGACLEALLIVLQLDRELQCLVLVSYPKILPQLSLLQASKHTLFAPGAPTKNIKTMLIRGMEDACPTMAQLEVLFSVPVRHPSFSPGKNG